MVVMRMAVVSDVDMIDANGLAGGLDAVVHLLAVGRGVDHHDLIFKTQDGAVGGDDAREDDLQQRRAFFKLVILHGVLNEVDDDGLLSQHTEREKQQDERKNDQQTIFHGRFLLS